MRAGGGSSPQKGSVLGTSVDCRQPDYCSRVSYRSPLSSRGRESPWGIDQPLNTPYRFGTQLNIARSEYPYRKQHTLCTYPLESTMSYEIQGNTHVEFGTSTQCDLAFPWALASRWFTAPVHDESPHGLWVSLLLTLWLVVNYRLFHFSNVLTSLAMHSPPHVSAASFSAKPLFSAVKSVCRHLVLQSNTPTDDNWGSPFVRALSSGNASPSNEGPQRYFHDVAPVMTHHFSHYRPRPCCGRTPNPGLTYSLHPGICRHLACWHIQP